MAKLVYGMMQSLDGYVDRAEGGLALPAPGPGLHHYWNERMATIAGSIFGRRMYEVMRFWDGPEADEAEPDFARAFRASPKWVVSRTLDSVGPNAELLGGDLRAEVEKLKASYEGEIEVAGPEIAGGLTELGLIDEYRMYLMPVTLGSGKAFFAKGAPAAGLELIGTEQLPEGVALVKYRRK
jgi:dihydrofolate reductase